MKCHENNNCVNFVYVKLNFDMLFSSTHLLYMITYLKKIHLEPLQALTLDCGNHWPGGPVNQKIHWPPKKPTGPPKTCNDPNVFAAGIYDFTREVAHFCTLGLYITKNKYELTLPSEFC